MVKISEQQSDLRDNSLDLLDFQLVRNKIASYTSFDVSREQALVLTPSYDHLTVDQLQQETAEALNLIQAGTTLDLSEVSDLRALLQRSSLGGLISGDELRQVFATLRSARQTKSTLDRAKDIPSLVSISDRMPNLQEIEKSLGSSIGDRGEILDDAAPALKTLRAQSQESYETLTESLQRTIRKLQRSKSANVLQEPIITQRNGRLVLLVKTDQRYKMPGIVHDVSDSGATLFVEPLSVISLGNHWRELRLSVQWEEERILRQLSNLVESAHKEIITTVALMSQLDLALARGRYALANHSIKPTIIQAEEPIVRLSGARHPLLEGAVVPITIELGPGRSTLLITGPNTGGKTVALKTVGLLILMAQSGLHLPSNEAVFTLFDGVYTDIGDQQSIQQSLSTFSSHIHKLRRIINQATQMSLVLIDELGSSTDPEEGSALAKAIIHHFTKRNITTLATTHHRQVASYVQDHPNMVNASVELDPQSLVPTYELTIGVPGRSYALSIASKIGLNEEILATAETFLPESHQGTETLLMELQLERHVAQQKHELAKESLKRAEEARQKLEKEFTDIQDAKARMLDEERQKLLQQANELQKRLKSAETKLTNPTHPQITQDSRAHLNQVRSELRSPKWNLRLHENREWTLNIQTGDQVYVTGLLQPVEILAPPDNEHVDVLIGSMRARLSIQQLEHPAHIANDHTTTVFSYSQPIKQVRSTLELQGTRVQPALERLEEYLNDATLAGLSKVKIVHGFGTGRLRSAIRRMLDGHPLVLSASPEEHAINDTVTIVRLA